MGDSTFQRTFAGGELAPALTARADLTKYVTGLRRLRNFIILRSGGVANRAGTRLVAECKTNSISVQLHSYVSAVAGESILIESGNGYLRFYKNGGPVTVSSVPAYNGATPYVIGDLVSSGGVNYYCKADTVGNAPPNASFWYAMPSNLLELPHPYSTGGWNAVQSGNVITMTSKVGGVPPYELIYSSLTSWVIRLISTAPGIAAPGGLVGTPGAAGTLTYAYQVTAGAADSFEESLSAGVASVPLTAAPTQAAPIALSWTPLVGAAEYYIYCDPYGNGTFGFIGTATADPTTGLPATFNDAGFTPDFAVTPPLPRVLFNTIGEYPRVAGYHQQRRFFANTDNNPDAIYGSRVGFYSNFNISSPLQDDDAITFKLAANQHNPVRHLVGLKTLIALTDAGEWNIAGPGGVLTPSGILADQEAYIGVAASPAPVIIGNSILYVQARGSIVHDLQFDQQVEGLGGRDLTIFASHLFDGYTILTMDYQQVPHSTVWVCRSDGTLLGLTYLREQDVWGWHRHDSGLSCRFEHVKVVPETNEDAVYVITRRTINGAFHRFVEKLESREIGDYNADSFFVDCGLSYSGAPVATFSGLGHLNGVRVAVLADGVVLSNGNDGTTFTVAGGAITIPTAAADVHIGIPIQYAEVETLDLDVAGSSVRDKKKKVGSVTLLIDRSTRSFDIGPDSAQLMPYKPNPWEGTAGEFSGGVEQAIVSLYNDNGRVFVRVKDPIPMTILGILPNVEMGG